MKKIIAVVAFLALATQSEAQTVGYKPWYELSAEDVGPSKKNLPIVGVFPNLGDSKLADAQVEMLQFDDEEENYWCNFADRRQVDAARKAEADLLSVLKAEGI